MTPFTLILPYYRNPRMLERQAAEWAAYPPTVNVIVVDDGSPDGERAHQILPADSRACVLRVLIDIPWNRNGARNLGATFAGLVDAEVDRRHREITPGYVPPVRWHLHTDIDHVLPAESAAALLERGDLAPGMWYRFRRFRVGCADSTRTKDALPPDAPFGEVKPHVDSFLIDPKLYWEAGGYDEDYSGSLGGSAPFLGWLKRLRGEAAVLEQPLHVHTSGSVVDASDIHLSRSRARFERIRAEKRAKGDPKPTRRLRFPWGVDR